MSESSGIEWCDASLNFATGCTKVSPGCANCYALERTIPRLQAMGQKKYANGTNFTVHESVMYEPLKWKKPSRIFVNSVSDTFYPAMSSATLERFFRDVVKITPQHTYILLTKRPERAYEFFIATNPLTRVEMKDYLYPNVWLGVTAENQAMADKRLPILRAIPTADIIRFVSVEPMLEAIDLSEYLGWLDWVIIGCESGKNRRRIEATAIINLVEQCQKAKVPVFLKQMEVNGRLVKEPALFDRSRLSSPPRKFVEYPHGVQVH